MTREEAERKCDELRTQHPDRETHQWQPREAGSGEWEILKIALPSVPGPSGTETVADERPPTGDDVRTSYDRNVGGPWVGG